MNCKLTFFLLLLQDQYENLSLHTQKGIDFLEKYGHFIRDRCSIEMEYAAKLRYVYWTSFFGVDGGGAMALKRKNSSEVFTVIEEE